MVRGFGFANVLREFGLPTEALGWSLFSFNLGVEVGQLAIVRGGRDHAWVIRRQSEEVDTREVMPHMSVRAMAPAREPVTRIGYKGVCHLDPRHSV